MQGELREIEVEKESRELIGRGSQMRNEEELDKGEKFKGRKG